MPVPFRIPLLLATAPAIALADPVFTEPIGIVRLGNTAGGATPAVPANTEVRLTIPLENTLHFSGLADSSASTSLSVAGEPGWASDEWLPASGERYWIIVTSGTQNGFRAVINGNSADSLTIDPATASPGTLADVTGDDSIEIRACWTLGTFFENSDISDDSQVFLFDRTESTTNQLPASSYIFSGGDWYRFEDPFPQSNDLILFPGEAFVLRSGSTAINRMSVSGDVPTSALRNEIARDGSTADDNHIGMMSPIPSIIGTLSLPAEDDDLLFIYDNSETGINKLPTDTLIRSGTQWFLFKDPYPDVTDTYEIEPGQGYVYRRASTAGSQADWTEPSP